MGTLPPERIGEGTGASPGGRAAGAPRGAAALADAAAQSGEFLGGVALLAFSVFVIAESLGMPTRGRLAFFVGPGFLPLLIGACLLVLSAVLTWQTVRKGAHRHLVEWWSRVVQEEDVRRWFILALINLGYVAAIGRAPFSVVTLAYFLVNFLYLRVGTWQRAVVYAAAATAFVAYAVPAVFQMIVP